MPVCDPGRTEGGGVIVALTGRPSTAVTSALAESLQRMLIGHPSRGWCPSDRADQPDPTGTVISERDQRRILAAMMKMPYAASSRVPKPWT
ncbi:hypothetical protein FHU40_003835, partial [Nocardioides soli]|nr:hypothetical protein [Nocardioides soli]